MADFKINDDMFGRYVRIQTDYSKALHIYKVVSLFASNTYCDIPILVSSKEVRHEQVVPVLNVIHCGIDESKVIRVALDDCEIVPTKDIETAADVAPVRHGRWVMPKGIIECSECGFGMFPDGYFFEFGECKHANESQYRPNYCPHCGARMDLEEKACP